MKRSGKERFFDHMGATLSVNNEQIKGRGEDAYISLANEQGAIVGCFDGCGGIGSRRYTAFGTHTGAYVSSRITAQATADWFLRGCECTNSVRFSEQTLAEGIRNTLICCRKMEQGASSLKGTLAKEFPTTLVAALADLNHISFYWAGDSRGYILDAKGLHQITVDDVEQQDAMANLSDDGPLKNVISASGHFVIHRKETTLRRPGVLLTCTDGCFSYLDSPMAFELLLLETLERAQSLFQWEVLLSEQIGRVAGDDYTLQGVTLGYGQFDQVKGNLHPRYTELRKRYVREKGQETLSAWWQTYKIEYEQY